MTATLEPAKGTDSSPLEPARLLQLYLRPRQFFAPDHDLDRKPELYLVLWLVGMAKVIDRIDQRLAQHSLGGSGGSNDLLVTVAASWRSFWIVLVLFGVLAGGFGWLIGGWWYGLRLHLSGVKAGYERQARLTWAYVALVTSLPVLLTAAIDTLRYENYIEASDQAGLSAFLVVGILFWSVIVSYRAATTRFQLNPGQAKLWFLILPIVVYALILVLFGTIAALFGGDGTSVAT